METIGHLNEKESMELRKELVMALLNNPNHKPDNTVVTFEGDHSYIPATNSTIGIAMGLASYIVNSAYTFNAEETSVLRKSRKCLK